MLESSIDKTIWQLLKESNETLPPLTETTVLQELLQKLGAHSQ